MPYTKEYNFDELDHVVITHYPELKKYLEDALGRLGSVLIRPHEMFADSCFVVELSLRGFPKIANWEDENPPPEFLYINSAAGGCFIKDIIVNCRYLPVADSKACSFTFELALDSRYVTVEKHSEQVVKDAIDRFVEMASKGFCYHFKNRSGQ